MQCPNCKLPQIIKYGKVEKQQRYHCKNCGYQFIEKSNEIIDYISMRHAILLYTNGCSHRETATLLNLSHTTILRWAKKWKTIEFLRKTNPIEKYSMEDMLKLIQLKSGIKNYKLLLIDLETGISYRT